MLTSGIFGTVVSIDDERIEVDVAEGVVLTVHRGAIGKVVGPVPPDEGDDSPYADHSPYEDESSYEDESPSEDESSHEDEQRLDGTPESDPGSEPDSRGAR